MTDIPTKKEYSEEEVMGLIKAQAANIKPSEAAFRAALAQIPQGVPSPYAPKKSFFTLQKLAITMLGIVVLLSGGTIYFRKTSAPGAALENGTVAMLPPTSGSNTYSASRNQAATMPASGAENPTATPMMMSMKSAPAEDPATTISNDNSDEGLAADEAKIDQQMAALDQDNAAADSAL